MTVRDSGGGHRSVPLLGKFRLGRRIVATDPGLYRLMGGWRMFVSVSVGVLMGWASAPWFGENLVTGIMTGGLVGFITSVSVSDNSARGIVKRCGFSILPLVIGLSASLALHEYRWAALLVLIVVLFVHMYGNVFGPLGHDFGSVLFASFLSGLLLPLPFEALGSLAAISAIALVAVIIARLVLCRIRSGSPLAYAEIAFVERSDQVLARAAQVLASTTERERARERSLRGLRQCAHRVNEAALVADASLTGEQTSEFAGTAERAHRLIFDAEQTAQALVRVTEALVRANAPQMVRANAAMSVKSILDGRDMADDAGGVNLVQWLEQQAAQGVSAQDAVVLHTYRLLALRDEYSRLARAWRAEPPRDADVAPQAFVSSVSLLAGRLPGSTLLGRRAVKAGNLDGRWARLKISQHLRTAIQATIAVAIVTPLSDLIDPDRFYWGAIGVLIILSATTSAHDRLRKLGYRVAGTIIGGAVGIALAHLLGTDHPFVSVIVAILALAVGGYCLGSYYGTWVIGLVVALMQIYNVTGPVTDALLAYRLAENVLGATVGIVVAFLVLPLSTRSLVKYGLHHYFSAMRALLQDAGAHLTGDVAENRLRQEARVVDSAAYELDQVLDSVLPVSRQSRRATDNIRLWLIDLTYNSREIANIASRGRIPREHNDAFAAVLNDVCVSTSRLEATTDAPPAQGETWPRQARCIDDLLSGLRMASDQPTHRLRQALDRLGIIDDTMSNWAGAAGFAVSGASYAELTRERHGALTAETLHQRLRQRRAG